MSPKKTIKSCPVCNTEFISYKCENKKICSRKCFSGYIKQHPEMYKNIRNLASFTGKKHSDKSKAKMRKATLRLISEGKRDMSAMSELARPFNTGANNVNWKGGISKINRTDRQNASQTKEYKQWRKMVFERDNYTCQICEQYNGVLHADHIERWADNKELRYTVTNGRTLCVACHYYITFKKLMKPGQRWCNFTARKTG